MIVTTAMIKELRAATGAGPLECKRALEAVEGDFQRASDALREKGLARASKKEGRPTTVGLVVVKEDSAGLCAVEVDCETDFVANTADFKALAHRLADQVLGDSRLTRAEPLLTAAWIEAPGKSVATAIKELIGKLGENIVVRHVVRYARPPAGLVHGYIHAGDMVSGCYGPQEGRLGVLVELGVEPPAAADPTALKALAHDLALHITSAAPRYLAPAEVPAEEMEPARDLCLLQQAFVKNERLTVEQLLRDKGSELGAVVTLKRFARLEVGAE